MKPFNLERALAGDPVVTQSGIKVAKLHLVPEEFDAYAPLHVLLENGETFSVHRNGSPVGVRTDKLYMESVKKKMWANIYKDPDVSYGAGDIYATEEIARHSKNPRRPYVATVPIEWEE